MNSSNIIKKFSICGFILLLAIAGNATNRVVENFNFGWKFHLGEIASGESTNLDDKSWQMVDLPHDFQIELPWLTPDFWNKETEKENTNKFNQVRARGFKAMEIGWYRKTFTPDPSYKGKRIIIDFEGIALVGDVWMNGEKVGGSDYGYCGFEIDITKHIHWDTANTLAVRASTGDFINSRWYTGGGLFRNVNLLIKDSQLSFARNAIYITTPQISSDKANVDIQVEVENQTGKDLANKVQVRILNPAGKEVASSTTQLSMDKEHLIWEYPLNEMTVSSPELWSCKTPNLYKAEVSLFDENNNMTDQLTENFGIRTIEYSPAFGFKLNGKKIILKGIANHNELGALGVAAYDRAVEKRFQLMKAYGMNHIRCSHNPYSKGFMDLADKYGILVVDEVFDKWNQEKAGGRAPWWDVWPYAVSEFIKRDRNHPSVVMWSLGNELQMYWDNEFRDWGVTPYLMQKALVKRYDTTRPTTVAMFPRRRYKSDLPPELALATEISSYNYRYYYFRGDSKTYPDKIFYQSEASVKDMGPNYFGMPLDSVIGLAYWGLIDYLGESQAWPYKGWKQGVFNIDLQPKPQAYLLKSIFSDEPLVHIGIITEENDIEWNAVNIGTDVLIDHWNLQEGRKLKLFTYTNADEVELFVNGHSLGRHKNQIDNPALRNQIRWENVIYHKGNITAIAYKNGKEVARHCIETTGKAVKLIIEPDNNPWIANGMDVKYIRIYAVDSKGRRVPEANQMLTFNVEGNARIAAVDNGDLTSNELHSGNKRSLFQGSATIILRSGKTAGNVMLKVSGTGYKSVKKEISIEANNK